MALRVFRTPRSLMPCLFMLMAGVAAALSAAPQSLLGLVKPVAGEHLAAKQTALLPLVFEENVGQASGEMDFLTRGPGYSLGLSSRGGTLTLTGSKPDAKRGRLGAAEVKRGSVVSTRLIGSNPAAKTRGERRLAAKINYFRGNDPQKWHTDVPAYQQVRTTGVYPGIDVVHYGNQNGSLEYDFVVAPAADPAQIRFTVEGAEDVTLANNGDLVIQVPDGEVRHRKPICYQETAGKRHAVDASFVLASASETVSFQLGDYDRSKPLIIDPVLDYSTYIGGSNIDRAYGVATDAAGRIYLAGTTLSADFPTTPSRYQGDPGNLNDDVFVAVLDPNQSGAAALIYATYLGGSLYDFAWGISVTTQGRVYVAGATYNPDFPTTSDALRSVHGGGTNDGFISILDPSQNGAASLVYSTFLGGNGFDGVGGIAVDDSGKAYLTGQTDSSTFPVTTGAFQTTNQGDGDAFFTVLDPSQSGAAGLVYSTFLGGPGNPQFLSTEADGGTGVAIDAAGRAFLTGYTASPSFPTTAGRIHGDPDTGEDAYLVVIDPSRSGLESLVYSTYLGGTQRDYGTGIDVDAMGRGCVVGTTASLNFPRTSSRFQVDPGDNREDVFVSVIDPSKSGTAALVYSTYLGGSDYDLGQAVAVDRSGRVCVTGSTESADFPRTLAESGPSQLWTVFVSVVDPTQQRTASLPYSVVFGADQTIAEGNAIAVDGMDRLTVAGAAWGTFPTTANRFQNDQPKGDAFVSILRVPPGPPLNLTASDEYLPMRIELNWTAHSTNADVLYLYRKVDNGSFAFRGSVPPNATSFTDTSVAGGKTYTYYLRARNGMGFSVPSNQASATPTPPRSPSNLKAVVGLNPRRVELTWTDRSFNETKFYIYRKQGDAPYAFKGSAPANSTAFTDASVAAATSYTYVVKAVGEAGVSVASFHATANVP